MEAGHSRVPRGRSAYAVTMALLFIGNGLVLPLVAYWLRHVTLTASTWRSYLTWSLVVGAAIPLLVVASVCVVALVARNPDRPPVTMFVFALCWSAPGLIANHNALSDLRRGPRALVEQVRGTTQVKNDVGQGHAVHVWRSCVVTFADGTKRTLDRYAVKYAGEDPCHGIQAGDRVRLTVLPRVDELVSIQDVGGAT